MAVGSRHSNSVVPDHWTDKTVWSTWGRPRRCVTGVSHKQDVFQRIVGPRRPGGYRKPVRVTLLRDPANTHDRNAIKAIVNNQQIGWLARAVAAKVAPEMDAKQLVSFDVPGVIVGGSSNSKRESYTCWLWTKQHFDGGLRIATIAGSLEDLQAHGFSWDWYLEWPSDDQPTEEKHFDLYEDEDGDLVLSVPRGRMASSAAAPTGSLGAKFDLKRPEHVAIALVFVLVLYVVLSIARQRPVSVEPPRSTPPKVSAPKPASSPTPLKWGR